MRWAVTDVRVADRDAMGFTEHATAGAARDFETFEHHVVGLLELDGVGTALQDRPRRAGGAPPADDHRTGCGTTVIITHHDPAAVGRATIDFDDVTWSQVVAGEDRG